MNLARGRRLLRRVTDRLRQESVDAGVEDPLTGDLFGALDAQTAIACGRATLGRHTYGAFTVRAGPGERGRVHIGAYCSIAEQVEFAVGGNHRVDWVSTYPFRVRFGLPGSLTDGHPRTERDIEVGNDVWIGAQALILAGVHIGDGAVVGARAVVTKDVRPYAIVAGVPARERRRRFSDEQVQALLDARWWEWPEETIRSNIDLLCSPDVHALIAAADRMRGV